MLKAPRTQALVAYVPEDGTPTIYATVGDLFAWLSATGLLALIGLSITRPRKHPTTIPVPAREPFGPRTGGDLRDERDHRPEADSDEISAVSSPAANSRAYRE